MNIHEKSRYHEVHARSLADPEGFWAEAAREIDWIEPAEKDLRSLDGRVWPLVRRRRGQHLLQRARPPRRGRTRRSGGADPRFAAHQHHLEIHLCRDAQGGADARRRDGRFRVAKGDRVILYMPLVPEAVFAMLACARIGAVHSVVFGGFAAKELGHRRVRLRLPDCRRPRLPAELCMDAARRRHRGGGDRARELPAATATPRSTGSACSPPPATTPRSRPPVTWPTASTRSSRATSTGRPAGRRLRAEAPEGRVMLSSQAQHGIENAACPVLVLPRGARIQFPRRSTSRSRPGWACAADVARRADAGHLRPYLGARLQNGVLTWPEPLRRLLAGLEGVDRLVLLGDSVELLEGATAQAMETARPCSRRSAAGWATAPGDPRPRQSRPAADRRMDPSSGGGAGDRRRGPGSTRRRCWAMSPRWLSPARVRVRYPGRVVADRVFATHGHYLDRHLLPVSAFGITRGLLGQSPARDQRRSTTSAPAGRRSPGWRRAYAPLPGPGGRWSRIWPS